MVDYRNDPVIQLSPGGTVYTVTDAAGNVQSGSVYKESYAGEVWAQPTGVVGGVSRGPVMTDAEMAEMARQKGVLVNAASAQQVRDNQAAARRRQMESQGMIMGLVPNPFAKYDKPLSNILAKSPMRQSAAAVVEAQQKAFPTTPAWAQTPAAVTVNEFISGYREEAQRKPTLFVEHLVLGYGIGKVFQFGTAALDNAAVRGLISQRAANVIPKVITYGSGGLYAVSTGIRVYQEPTNPARARKLGQILSVETTPLIVGGALSTPGAFKRLRPGFSTEQIQRTEPIKTIDLRETIDLSKSKIYNPAEYVRPVTRAERAMMIRQYRLTPEEVGIARRYGLNLDQILSLRARTEIPVTYKPQPIRQTAILEQSAKMKAPAITPPVELVQPRVRLMYGFVPDVFTTPRSAVELIHGSNAGIRSRQTPIVVSGAVPSQQQRDRTILITQPVTITKTIVEELTRTRTVTVPDVRTITNNQTTTLRELRVVEPKMPKGIVPPPPVFPVGFIGGGGRGYSRPGWYRGARWKNPVPTIASVLGNYNPLRKGKRKRRKPVVRL